MPDLARSRRADRDSWREPHRPARKYVDDFMGQTSRGIDADEERGSGSLTCPVTRGLAERVVEPRNGTITDEPTDRLHLLVGANGGSGIGTRCIGGSWINRSQYRFRSCGHADAHAISYCGARAASQRACAGFSRTGSSPGNSSSPYSVKPGGQAAAANGFRHRRSRRAATAATCQSECPIPRRSDSAERRRRHE